jgi:hemerythrin
MSSTIVWPIEWLEDFETGIPQVDTQHRRLVEIANNLHSFQASPARLRGALEDLMAYTQYHFALEERLMESVQCPGLADHRVAHEALAAQVTELWGCRDTVPFTQVLDLLMAWLLNHILICDRELRAVAHKLA